MAEEAQLRKKTTLIDLEKAFREVCLIKTKSSNHMFSMFRERTLFLAQGAPREGGGWQLADGDLCFNPPAAHPLPCRQLAAIFALLAKLPQK